MLTSPCAVVAATLAAAPIDLPVIPTDFSLRLGCTQLTQGSITCGVADFMERIEFKYGAKAKEAGCCVASAAGFDSVPADVGTLWTQRKFGPKGVPATVESYVTMHCERRLRGAPAVAPLAGTYLACVSPMRIGLHAWLNCSCVMYTACVLGEAPHM